MRTSVAIAFVLAFGAVDLAAGQIGADASRVICEKVVRATDGQARIKKATFTVSLFTNGLTCIVKTPPKSRCFATTVVAIDPPPPTTVVPGVTTPSNVFNCYAMKCPKGGGGSSAAPDDFTPNGQIVEAKSPDLYCTPVRGE